MAVKDPWFEVYKIHPGVFAIYEPHQSEEVICHVLLGTEPAVLFDTGLGISIRAGGMPHSSAGQRPELPHP